MNCYNIITSNNIQIINCQPEFKFLSEKNALEMVAICGEIGTDRLLFSSANLTDEFYNLRTGLAGEVLQKLTNYFIKAAIVIPSDLIPPGHFSELVYELNQGWQFRFFETQEAAVHWLAALTPVRYSVTCI